MTKTLPKFSKDITFIWFIIKGHLYKPSEIDRVSFILFGSFFFVIFFSLKRWRVKGRVKIGAHIWGIEFEVQQHNGLQIFRLFVGLDWEPNCFPFKNGCC